MFDFEKLEIYKKAKAFNSQIRQFLKISNLDPTTNDQLRRASFPAGRGVYIKILFNSRNPEYMQINFRRAC